MRPLCEVCGVHPATRKGTLSGGDPRWGRLCASCGSRPYTLHKKDHCEQCGFDGHRVQLDVDHIDGDKGNNDPENLQTLCANCHRLKTYENADWKEKS